MPAPREILELVARFEQQLDACTQIDRLVYDLYGLTEDEIKIVEGKAAAAPPPQTAEVVEPTAKPRRPRRAKSGYAKPPPAPIHPSLTPEKAYADAAHFYGKEEGPPYRTPPPEPEIEDRP